MTTQKRSAVTLTGGVEHRSGLVSTCLAPSAREAALRAGLAEVSYHRFLGVYDSHLKAIIAHAVGEDGESATWPLTRCGYVDRETIDESDT